MNPFELIDRYYPRESPTRAILLDHSRRVAEKAVAIARRLGGNIDTPFLEEAALLHDIGILHTNAPDLGCHGDLPYLAHGYMGRSMLEEAGLFRHALVCDRHIGVGISAEEIRSQKLPLPKRDMIPLSTEEEIITYADLFFSKSPRSRGRERTADEVRKSLMRFGQDKGSVFDAWHARFSL